jgi:hypothetical protein
VTFFEALKANETKRVRHIGDEVFFEPVKLINFLLSDTLDIAKCIAKPWEVAEETRELWVIFDKDGTAMIDLYGKEDAIDYAKQLGCSSVALYREVPGTREEVKE